MAITTYAPKQELFGPNDKQVKTLIDRLLNVEWYQHIGTDHVRIEKNLQQFMEAFDLHAYETEWVPLQDVPGTIKSLELEGSQLWDVVKEVPDKISEKGKATGRKDSLDQLVHDIPELVYHGAFAGAYNHFQNQQAVSLLVGHAMYISLLACAWEVVADQSGWEENPFIYLIEIREEGHMPIGPKQNIFYLA
ncbi:hypothetical protein [Thalassobacillus sp. CUG 92003]|uniref:hypothetical protein n=1 Tax=Thalassobacillus sp. CUG 92003 TaxID=2736641 RepID=UPI0015E7438C|nr:hypothetical protein [Thalassobacillus sp. CUG 92003]